MTEAQPSPQELPAQPNGEGDRKPVPNAVARHLGELTHCAVPGGAGEVIAQLKEDWVSRQAPRRGEGREGVRRQSICKGRDM